MTLAQFRSRRDGVREANEQEHRKRASEPQSWFVPSQERSGGSAAVKDVVAELLHFEDGGVRAPGNRLSDMRLDDLADDDVVVALLDDAGNLALDRRRRCIEDRYPGRALVNGLTRELAVFELGRLEEGEGDRFAVLAQHVQCKGLRFLDDAVGAGIG